jgi:hypothetical protein
VKSAERCDSEHADLPEHERAWCEEIRRLPRSSFRASETGQERNGCTVQLAMRPIGACLWHINRRVLRWASKAREVADVCAPHAVLTTVAIRCGLVVPTS